MSDALISSASSQILEVIGSVEPRLAEATRQELSNLDAPHRMRQVLEVSADECQTWQSMLG